MARVRGPLLLAIILALAVPLLLWVTGNPFARSELRDGDGTEEHTPGEDLIGAREKGPAAGPRGATLTGRVGEPRHDGPERGPLTVRVVNDYGLPLADVPVHLDRRVEKTIAEKIDAAALKAGHSHTSVDVTDDEPEYESVQVVRTDAQGHALFPDVPYDGSRWARVQLFDAGMDYLLSGYFEEEIEEEEEEEEVELEDGSVVILGGVVERGTYEAPADNEELPEPPLPESEEDRPEPDVGPSGKPKARVATPIFSPAQTIEGFAEPIDMRGPFPSHVIRQRVKGAELTLTVGTGLPFELRAEDRETGRLVPHENLQVMPGFSGKDGEHVRGAIVAPPRGAVSRFELEASLPRGYVRWHGWSPAAWVSPAARRLTCVAPVYREARVRVLLPGDLSDPIAEIGVSLAGSSIAVEPQQPSHRGSLRVSGIPFLARAPVSLSIRTKDGRVFPCSGVLPEHPREELVLEALEPLESMSVSESWSSVSFSDLRFGWDRFEPEGDELGSLHLLVRGPAGDPLPGAVVHLMRGSISVKSHVSDREGRVTVRAPGGNYALHVAGAGAAYRVSVAVVAGETRRRTLEASHGGTLEVQVLDEQGEPLPYAVLHVRPAHRLPYADLRGDVQRVDMHTDVRGQRTLHQVPVGIAYLSFLYKGRVITQEVRVFEGRTQRVRLLGTPPPEKAGAKGSEAPSEGD